MKPCVRKGGVRAVAICRLGDRHCGFTRGVCSWRRYFYLVYDWICEFSPWAILGTRCKWRFFYWFDALYGRDVWNSDKVWLLGGNVEQLYFKLWYLALFGARGRWWHDMIDLCASLDRFKDELKLPQVQITVFWRVNRVSHSRKTHVMRKWVIFQNFWVANGMRVFTLPNVLVTKGALRGRPCSSYELSQKWGQPLPPRPCFFEEEVQGETDHSHTGFCKQAQLDDHGDLSLRRRRETWYQTRSILSWRWFSRRWSCYSVQWCELTPLDPCRARLRFYACTRFWWKLTRELVAVQKRS